MLKRFRKTSPPKKGSTSGDNLVVMFLRGQNLEQVGRVEEAISLYEDAVSSRFDAAGPYDRLIFIYQQSRMHADVIRVAEESIRSVRTYPQKLDWYRAQIVEAKKSLDSPPAGL